MKFKLILFFIVGWIFCSNVFAQNSDFSGYQQSFGDCNVELQKLNTELSQLRYDMQEALKQLRQGYFCSLCNKSKLEIEKEDHEDFYSHIQRVKGEIIPATQAQIEQNQNKYLDQINNLQQQINNQNSNCNQIKINYEQARQRDWQAQQQAQQQAQILAQQKAQQLAEQKREALMQLMLEQQRRRQEQLQRQQAQLNANQNTFQNNINQISAQTQARLQDSQLNSRIDNSQSIEVASSAQNIDKSTSRNDLGQQAFGDQSADLATSGNSKNVVSVLNPDSEINQANEAIKHADEFLSKGGYNFTPEVKMQIEQINTIVEDPECAIKVEELVNNNELPNVIDNKNQNDSPENYFNEINNDKPSSELNLNDEVNSPNEFSDGLNQTAKLVFIKVRIPNPLISGIVALNDHAINESKSASTNILNETGNTINNITSQDGFDQTNVNNNDTNFNKVIPYFQTLQSISDKITSTKKTLNDIKDGFKNKYLKLTNDLAAIAFFANVAPGPTTTAVIGIGAAEVVNDNQ